MRDSTATGSSRRESWEDRRTSRRRAASELPTLSARLVAGPQVTLIDVSEGGARFESGMRLLPGSNVGLRLVAENSIFLVMGRVLRSRVSRVDAAALYYESAVAFDRKIHLLDETGAQESTGASGSPDTDGTASEAAPESPSPAEDILTFTAYVSPSDLDVSGVLNTNKW